MQPLAKPKQEPEQKDQQTTSKIVKKSTKRRKPTLRLKQALPEPKSMFSELRLTISNKRGKSLKPLKRAARTKEKQLKALHLQRIQQKALEAASARRTEHYRPLRLRTPPTVLQHGYKKSRNGKTILKKTYIISGGKRSLTPKIRVVESLEKKRGLSPFRQSKSEIHYMIDGQLKKVGIPPILKNKADDSVNSCSPSRMRTISVDEYRKRYRNFRRSESKKDQDCRRIGLFRQKSDFSRKFCSSKKPGKSSFLPEIRLNMSTISVEIEEEPEEDEYPKLKKYLKFLPKTLEDSNYYITDLRNYYFSGSESKHSKKFKEHFQTIFEIIRNRKKFELLHEGEIKEKSIKFHKDEEIVQSKILIIDLDETLVHTEFTVDHRADNVFKIRTEANDIPSYVKTEN